MIVGVFGSVFNVGSYLLMCGSIVNDVMKLVGGVKKGVDEGSVFVLCVNGSVVSVWQMNGGWLSMGLGVDNLQVLLGDMIFVLEELDKMMFVQLV